MKTVYWDDNALYAVDQTLIPYDLKINRLDKLKDVCVQIENMGIRGATAVGVAGAFAVVMAAIECTESDVSGTHEYVLKQAEHIKMVRPTGRNLTFDVGKMVDFANHAVKRAGNKQEYICALLKMAQSISDDEEESSRRVADYCSHMLKDGSRLITHCHTGPLSSVNYGNAAGGAIMAHEQGKKIHVYVNETRPRLQGAKINTFELKRHGVPFTLITDNMAAYIMSNGMIDIAMVGADRIVANGDCAAKIGAYSLAIFAKENKIPFFMCATLSHMDFSKADGNEIVIEQRDPNEVRVINGISLVDEDVAVINPAFDITPAKYITGIITDGGIAYPPFEKSLKEFYNKKFRN